MNSSESLASTRVEIAVAVVERDGQVLVGLRPEGTPLAGYWEFPGGKMVADETPEDAARRECWEETGVAVRVTGSYPTTSHDYKHAAVRLHFLACSPVGEPASLPPRFRWVPLADLPNYRFPPANDAVLRQLSAGAAR